MTPQKAIQYIENYTWSTTRLGLGRTRELLHAMGDPQKNLKFIHVAGSNGKGSTCAMLDAILRHAGYRTGLYTSPYIQDFCERIQVNGRNIPGEDLARITESVLMFAEAMEDHPSQFELTTAIAMKYYFEQACDFVVLEVGMGGALDSTNVIGCPEAAVITNIGLEHTEYLGDTLTLIAEAKGGIIKPGCDTVCYSSDPEVMETLERICREQNAAYHVSLERDVQSISHDLDGQRFLWKGHEYFLSLLGPHQLRNAAVVLETVQVMRGHDHIISEDAVKAGLRDVRWPARFEILRRAPLFILDGGHNPQCAEAMVRNLREYFPGQKLTILLGVLADKDYRQILDLIVPFAESFICVTPVSPRALPADALAAVISERGFPALAAESIEDGVRMALEAETPVMAFGSLYLAGYVRTVFPRELKKWQRKSVLHRRSALSPEYRAAASAALCRRLTETDAYRRAGTIFLYKAVRGEPDLSVFEEQAGLDGKTLVYPWCPDRTTMVALKPGDAWETGFAGIPVPVPDQAVTVDPADIDLVLCPCSAFDEEGRRLGMGRGYYDRFLPQCEKAYKILIAFEAQRLDQVCAEDTDVPMDAAVTEERMLVFR